MEGQMTIFDWLKPQFDWDEALLYDLKHRGSLFAGGKKRIRGFYESGKPQAERVKLLAKEYGIGGHSQDYSDGSRGMIESDSKGITLRKWEPDEKKTYPWKVIDTMIESLIKAGEYE